MFLFGVPSSGSCSASSTPRKRCTPNLPHQESQHIGAAVSEVANNDKCASQNNSRVTSDKTDLKIANHPRKVSDDATQTVDDAVNHTEIENLPKTFARSFFDWIDDRAVVNLINVIFVFQ